MAEKNKKPYASLDQNLIGQFISIVGPSHAVTAAAEQVGYLTEWREKYNGVTPVVLLPGSVDEVAAILRLASATETAIVPQGGNTGLVGGQLPDQSGAQILLSLKRLRAVRDVSPESGSLTVEAGVTLLEAQEAARAAGLDFPLSLASEGTCQIGGVISTNAGGVQVLKHGMMRALVLGLEVVLPDGALFQGLGDLRKDNTGYDLKQLFIGAEGTLGVVTAATLKLVPAPLERQVAFVGAESLEDLARFFTHCQKQADTALGAFEILPHIGLEMVAALKASQGLTHKAPLEHSYNWYGLIELESSMAGQVEPMITSLLEAAFEQGMIKDAIVSMSETQRTELWALREMMSEAQKIEGGSIKHDVSVPVASIPAFIAAANQVVEEVVPGARPVPFGHFGDGNIHYNITQPSGMVKAVFLAEWERLNRAVYEVVLSFGGSISAEHGIGVMKRDLLLEVADPVKLKLMRQLKATLDPKGIMNPGKMI